MKIKKGWKITWISLGSLLGVVVLVLCVAMWIIFTPSQLTKLVNKLAGNFLTCEAHFENVDFTLISTFPDAGLKIKNVTLVKKMDGAPNDTLAFIGDVTVGIDLMAYLKRDEVIVHQVYVDNAKANLYIDKEGRCNYDILPPSEDTTSKSEPPALIDLKKVEVKNLTARLKDERDGLDAELCGFGLAMDGHIEDSDIKGRLQADCHELIAHNQAWNVEVEQLSMDANVDKQGLSVDALATVGGKKVALTLNDSVGSPSLATVLEGFTMQLDGDNSLNVLNGMLDVQVENGTFDMAGQQMVNSTLQEAQAPLLKTHVPFSYNLITKELKVEESHVDIADVGLIIGGEVDMDTTMKVDVALRTADDWPLKEVLSYIPEAYSSFRKGMEVDGRVCLEATAKGSLGNGEMPVVDVSMMIDDGLYYCPTMLPYRISSVSGRVEGRLDMTENGVSMAKVDRLYARTKDSRLILSGRADDLLGQIRVDAAVKGSLPLHDVYPMLPEGMNLRAEGDATLDAQAKFALADIQSRNFEKITASGNVKVQEVDVDYNGLCALVPEVNVDVVVPAQLHKDKLADVHITGGGEGSLRVENGTWRVESQSNILDIKLGVNNLLKTDLAAEYDIAVGETEAAFDSTSVSTGGLALKGTMHLDPSKEDFLGQYNPRFNFSTHSAMLLTSKLPEALQLTELELDYKPEMCEIVSAQLKMGRTDLDLFGRVEDLEPWLEGNAMLRGYLNFSSEYSDVDQMMDLFSGVGSDPDSLEAMRKEDTVPAEANPFIVPKNVDITLLTHIKRSVAFGNDLRDLSGELTVKDGVAILDQMGFTCKAARMQLTAIYKSPRPNNLFTSIDFHLLDIQIDELLDMIPCIDTLVPMLKAFDGNADFHLAGETFLNARYQPKMSSLLGSAAISGKDLVVFEDESLAKTAKLIGLKSWKDDDNKIRIDSMSVEMTCFRKEIEVYPFLLNMGKYSFCISGVHTLDNLCNYHIELLKNPLIIQVGVDIKGSLSDPKISLGKVRYGDFYKPEKKGVASKKALELKNMIRRELERNVR